jgi:HEAT repeat protein
MKARIAFLALTSVALAATAISTMARHRQQSQAERLVNEMLVGQRSPDPELLRKLGPQALPPLIKALAPAHPVVEEAYDSLPYPLQAGVSKLLPQLLDNQYRRMNAAAWVGFLGPAAKPAVPFLIKLLKDNFADGNAANSLALIGPPADEAVPALLVALQEHRPFAAIALGSIGTPKTVASALEKAFQQGPAWQREEARVALNKLRARFPG